MQTLQNTLPARIERSDKKPLFPPPLDNLLSNKAGFHPLEKRLKKHLILFLDSSGRRGERDSWTLFHEFDRAFVR